MAKSSRNSQSKMVENVSSGSSRTTPTVLSIGILVWNEVEAIGPALESLFSQSLFAELMQRRLGCEILCVANGCTDDTPAIADRVFQAQSRSHPFKASFACRMIDLPERGKLNAWNRFVHDLSAKESPVLFLMDGDILLHDARTLWNMYTALNENPQASIATDQPLKDIALKSRCSFGDKLSLATSRMTQRGSAQVTGQLYAIRSAVARNIYLPHDLVACEDGFIKALVCTNFLTHDPDPARIVLASNASHVFEAYTRFTDVLRNQKRQTIGQTIVHILVDRYLKHLSLQERLRLADILRAKEQADPEWLKRLIAAHLLQVRYFWRLFPDLVAFRFRRLRNLPPGKRLLHLPAAIVGFIVALWAARLAFKFLKQGSTHYWPDTKSPQLGKWTVPPHAPPSESVVKGPA